MTARPPNIVIVNPDEWRGDVSGHLGNPAASTPNLDRLVEHDAVSFRWAFCQSPVCVPSRCSFMTGWYPHVRGHRTQHHMLRAGEPNLLTRLKDAGYFVWWGGKNDLVPAQHGFDRYCHVRHTSTIDPPRHPIRRVGREWSRWWPEPGPGGYYSFYAGRLDPGYDNDQYHIDAAIDVITHRRDDRPFCLYLPLGNPHPPYGVEDPWYSSIDRCRIPARAPTPGKSAGKPAMTHALLDGQGLTDWTEQQWTELRATYYGMCARVDNHLGTLVDALRQAGVYDNTALLFFSDHGDYIGDHGLVEKAQNLFEDALTRVPLVIKPPRNHATRPGVRDALVELVDITATIEEFADLPTDHWHFGRSLTPLIDGSTALHRDAVFSEGGRLPGETQAMELPSNQQPQGLYYPRMRIQREDDTAHTKAVMIRTRDYKYVYRLYESDELYDLQADPQETTNQINNPTLGNVRNDLANRLTHWLVETADVVPTDYDQR